ncbi:MAG: hypothetical protein IIY74_04550 [Firmicutes bacterium]|nr:hypothetical protein [Bacillota bacterium]
MKDQDNNLALDVAVNNTAGLLDCLELYAGKHLECLSNKNILGGANADYFTFATGTSLGPVVKAGTVCTSEHSSFEEIGFFEDGSALMGRMGLNVEFTELVTGQVYPLMAFNKDLERGGGLVLYSKVFGDTNNASGEGLNVLIRIDEGEARIGETIKGTIESVFDSDGPVALDEGHLLLSVYKDTKYLTVIPILLAMKEGDGVTVSFSSDPEWQDVYHVVGGAERLIKDESFAPSRQEAGLPGPPSASPKRGRSSSTPPTAGTLPIPWGSP